MTLVGAFLNWFLYMRTRGPRYPGAVLQDLPESAFPIGYGGSQLLFAWEWSLRGELIVLCVRLRHSNEMNGKVEGMTVSASSKWVMQHLLVLAKFRSQSAC